MKKNVIILAILLILPIISAVQVDMNHELKQGENLIVKISGNFLEPPLKNNIYFQRGYTNVPFEFDLIKINQDYFISSSTVGKTSGNYSIVIKNSKYYTEGAQISTEDIISNFSITSNYSDFSVKPGVLIAEGSFLLTLQNLRDHKITIYIDKNNSQGNQGSFSFLMGNNLKGQAYDLNAGEIKPVSLEFEGVMNDTLREVRLSTDDFSTSIFVYALYTGESIILNQSNQSGNFSNQSGEINQTPIKETLNKSEQIPSISESCSNLNGTICTDNQKCVGNMVDASDGKCCLDSCVEKKKSKTGQIIGWSLVIILVFAYIWFYFKKYKKAKKKVNLLEVAEGKKSK